MISIFAVLFFPFALLRRIPVLFWYCHGATSFTLRLAHKAADRVVTCSPEGFRLLSSKVRIIGHGIDTDIFRPVGKQHASAQFRLLTVGRLSPVKHCDVLIRAVQELVSGGDGDLRYTLVGGLERSDPAGYEAYLRQLVQECRLDAVVTFSGAVPFHAVPPLYQEAELFLHASTTGSMDKAVLEAMSSGCPVLTSSPAFKNILGELSSRLYVPQNDPKLFTAYIKSFRALSPEERAAIGSRLRRRVMDDHSLKGLAARIVHELAALQKGAGKFP
jgi:glycosyltransferase involved in cell wall biosynthesis